MPFGPDKPYDQVQIADKMVVFCDFPGPPELQAICDSHKAPHSASLVERWNTPLLDRLVVIKQTFAQRPGQFLFSGTHETYQKLASPVSLRAVTGRRPFRTAIYLVENCRMVGNWINITRLMRVKFGSDPRIITITNTTPMQDQIESFRSFDLLFSPFGSLNGNFRHAQEGSVIINTLPLTALRFQTGTSDFTSHHNLSTIVLDPNVHENMKEMGVRYYQILCGNDLSPNQETVHWKVVSYSCDLDRVGAVFDDSLKYFEARAAGDNTYK